MDTIKSYINRIIPNNTLSRKGSDKLRRARSRERSKPGGIPQRSASTSHVNFDPCESDGDSTSIGSVRTFSPNMVTFRHHHHRASEPHCSTATNSPINGSNNVLRHPHHHHHHHHLFHYSTIQNQPEVIRTPPPSKPPRKDLIFSVQLDTEGIRDIGIEIDCVAMSPTLSNLSYNSGTNSDYSPPTPSIGDRRRSPQTMPSQTAGITGMELKLKSDGGRSLTPSESQMNRTTKTDDRYGLLQEIDAHTPPQTPPAMTFRIMSLASGSGCHLDGRIKVNDEIVDINGDSVHKETLESVR